MSAVWKFLALLLAILASSPESETANITAFIANSSSPSYAEEGQSFTLEWSYTLDGIVRFVQFSIITSSGSELLIGRKFGIGVIPIEPVYQARFRAQATNTRVELNILAVQKSDETTYRVNIVPSGSGSLTQLVVVIVHYPPTITVISGNQTVTEGGNVTLECQADSKPKTKTTWTRLSDNSVVNVPLTNIRRQDAGKYRCTADNGVGSPSTRDVLIVVQYPVEAIDFGENATVPQGDNKTFSCLVDGIPKPNISWYRGSKVRGKPIFSGEKFEASERGCYTCVASNSLGKPVTIIHCLKDEEEEEEFSTVPASTTSASKGPSRTVIGVVIGVAVFVVIMIGVMTWWVWKKKKHGKRTNNAELQYEEVDQMNNGGS